MNAHDAIKLSTDMSSMLSEAYLGDLSDTDLLHRPAPDCNHINWQLGHLIVSENSIISKALPGSVPPLPAGFAEKYTKETAKVNDLAKLCTKADLLQVHKQQRTAVLAALAKASAADLDKPSNNEWAPTLGAAFSAAIGGHWLMHVGQWAVVRRQLGRPPLF